MKKTLLLGLMICVAFFAQAQENLINKHFSQYLDDENFTSVFISPKMFQMIAKMDIDTDDPNDKELINTIKSLKSLVILTTKVNPERFYQEAFSKIPFKEYEELMTIRDKGKNVRFVVKESNNLINELIMLIGSKEETVFMSFSGNIDLNKISKLGSKMDIKGIEHLEKVNDKPSKN